MTSETDTLHLPRLLCLHGGGTNAQIFRLQCRVLERALLSSYRFVYADAPITPVTQGPDVTSVFASHGPFRAWLSDDTDTGAAIDSSFDRAMASDPGTGPFVGLLGFSQGARVAGSLLLRQQLRGEAGFRFAILVAGRGPLDVFGTVAEGQKLRIPTVHVHGLLDPGLQSHRELLECCEPRTVAVLEWDGEHRLPIRSADVERVVQAMEKVARETGCGGK
ncbi:hypothetical protein ANO11243_007790 [Dothideomycetidae sp. 11243]|nr:hypothetical protein ANO11243_007790 [fungal sp. No.11243]